MAMMPRLAATLSQLDMPGNLEKGQAAEDAEKDEDGNEAKKGPGLGAAQEAAEREIAVHGTRPQFMAVQDNAQHQYCPSRHPGKSGMTALLVLRSA